MRSIGGRSVRAVLNPVWMGALLVVFQAHGSLLAEEDEDLGSTFARVRYAEGVLNLESAQEGEITEAGLNSPLAPGDTLQAESGRAEIALADGSVIWLEEGTRLTLRSLTDINNRYERSNVLALGNGSLRIEAAEPGRDEVFRIDTEAGSVYLLSGGSIRIDAEEGTTTVSSLRGVAEVSGDAGSALVRTGERCSVRAGRTPSEPRAFNTLRQDDFDRFCEVRGAAYMRRDGEDEIDTIEEDIPREVSPYVRELTVYGGWHMVPDYGWVWRPTYYGAWAPYVNGYWTWCPTGWAWVSYDVWGWAPYHYGRWDHVVSLGWVWIPGRVWSGAWVSFAIGSSHIGWCPLNYYNRPVFQDASIINVVNIQVNRLDTRGWRFVPLGRFRDRRGERFVRADRLARGTELVVSRRLPRFSPKEITERPERGRSFLETARSTRTPLPVAGPPDRPLSFLNLERGSPGRRPSRGEVQPSPRGRSSQERGRPRPQPGPSPQTALPRAPVEGHPPRVARPGETTREPRVRPQETGGGVRRPQQRVQEPSRSQPGQRVEPRRSAPSRSAPPRPQARETDPRGGHVVEKIIGGVRRDRAETRGPAREQPRAQKKATGSESRERLKGPPPRPPRKEEDKDH
jgi:uncharacterized protein DUF6600/FecR-like protein